MYDVKVLFWLVAAIAKELIKFKRHILFSYAFMVNTISEYFRNLFMWSCRFFRDLPLKFMANLYFTTLNLKKKQIEVHKFLNFKYTYLIRWAKFRKIIHYFEEIA